jgi:YVTN family beta-propeller protein
MLAQRAIRHPLLIAEFLIQETTCALGCWLLTLHSYAQMVPAGEAHDSERVLTALHDGLGLLQRLLEGEAPGRQPAEAAALLAAASDFVGRPRRLQSADPAEAMVLGALQGLGTAAAPVVDALAALETTGTLDAPAFVAALELIAGADVAEVVTPERLTQTYVQVVRVSDRQLSAELGRAGLVAEVNPRDFTIVRTYPVGWRAWNLALSPDEKRLYTANGLSGDMSVIDIVSNKPVATVKLGGRPWGIVAAP